MYIRSKGKEEIKGQKCVDIVNVGFVETYTNYFLSLFFFIYHLYITYVYQKDCLLTQYKYKKIELLVRKIVLNRYRNTHLQLLATFWKNKNLHKLQVSRFLNVTFKFVKYRFLLFDLQNILQFTSNYSSVVHLFSFNQTFINRVYILYIMY